jgi:putative flippase GtrA
MTSLTGSPPHAREPQEAETTSTGPNRTSARMIDRLTPARRAELARLVRFAGIGIASTVAYGLLFLVFRHLMGAFTANALALLLTAVANTAANRRLTFGVRGSSGALGDHTVGLLAFGAGLALTSGSLAVLHATGNRTHSVELVVLMVANAVSTLLRFVALRLRIVRPARSL